MVLFRGTGAHTSAVSTIFTIPAGICRLRSVGIEENSEQMNFRSDTAIFPDSAVRCHFYRTFKMKQVLPCPASTFRLSYYHTAY